MIAALEQIFRDCFAISHNTLLQGGASEPLYLPAPEETSANLIRYREDYFASALHEVAHWCIAGDQRRQLEDYGYWYAPDGRCAEQQQRFESVEVCPQAVEWHFALACGVPFRVSIDNLHGAAADATDFTGRVRQQAQEYALSGLPQRALVFRRALASRFGGIGDPAADDFS